MTILKEVFKKAIVDLNTGEVTNVVEEQKYKIRTTIDYFYYTFVKAVDFESVLSKAELRLLAQMNKYSQYNTNEVYLNKALRERIAYNTNLSYQTILNATNSLKQKGIIEGSGGLYLINPHFHWKGELKERDKLIKELNIKFEIVDESEIDGRRITVVDAKGKETPYQFGLGNILNNIDCR